MKVRHAGIAFTTRWRVLARYTLTAALGYAGCAYANDPAAQEQAVSARIQAECRTSLDALRAEALPDEPHEAQPGDVSQTCTCVEKAARTEDELLAALRAMVAPADGRAEDPHSASASTWAKLRLLAVTFECAPPDVRNALLPRLQEDASQAQAEAEAEAKAEATREEFIALTHFMEGALLVETTLQQNARRMALGQPTVLPETANGWIALINPEGLMAPGGGPAFVAAPQAARGTGAVEVSVAGSVAAGDLVVTLHMLPYRDMEELQRAMALKLIADPGAEETPGDR